MKNFCKVLGLVGALAFGTTLVSAASAEDTMRVNVPFTFVAAGKVFPAGQYTVQQTDSGLILIQGQRVAAAALGFPNAPAKAGSASALHFKATDGQEYLITVDSDSGSRTLPLHVLETRTLTLSK